MANDFDSYVSRPGTRRRKSIAGVFAALVLVGALCFLAMPTMLIVLIGLIPTMVAYVIDRDPEKSAPLTVGAMNFCGVMPYLIDLWREGHEMATAFGLFTQPLTWLVMYGSAGIGWLLYFGIPPIIAHFVVVRDGSRVTDIEAQQRALIEEWGFEVTGRPAIGDEAAEDVARPSGG